MTKILLCTSNSIDWDIAFEPFLEDMKQGNIALMGNREYNSHIFGIIETVCDAVDHFGCYDFVDIIDDLGYTPKADRTELYKLFNRPTCSRCSSYYSDTMRIADILTFITGDKWETTTIHGSCQGDYQDVIYNTRLYSKEYISELKDIYFGAFYSVGVIEDDTADADPVNVDYWDYISYYHDSKKEIADRLGLDVDTLEVFKEEEHHITTYSYTAI